jgi:hypothetical protein
MIAEPPSPPNLEQSHKAISLHFKIFSHAPDWLWHNGHQRWYPRSHTDTLIELYVDRVRGWFIDCVRQAQHNSGFIKLMVAISYIEKNERYREGDNTEGNARRYFQQGLSRIFPHLSDDDCVLFWKAVRCGLFHEGMTRRSILLSSAAEAVVRSGDHLVVSPDAFLDAIDADLTRYAERLREGVPHLIANFCTVFQHHEG